MLMVKRLTTSQWLPVPVEQVFAFFASPENLPRLMPPELRTRIEELRLQPPPPCPSTDAALPAHENTQAAGVGTEIVISFCPVPWLPFRVRWVARIVEFAWHSHFVDEQVRGPFRRFRHRHGIQPEMRNGTAGTLVSDDLEFSLPFGWLGSLAAGLVRRQLMASFRARQERLPQMLASGAETPQSS